MSDIKPADYFKEARWRRCLLRLCHPLKTWAWTDRMDAMASDRNAQIREAVSLLPRQYQKLLVLLMADPPVSYAEISSQLGIPIGSIGPTRALVLERLRKLLSTATTEVPQVDRTAVSPRQLTKLAAFLAGRKRSGLREEWRTHLSGETGHGLARSDQIRAARGFLRAAVRYRLRDAADLAWWPVDAVLRSRTLSNLTVWIPVLLAVLAVVRRDGFFGLVTNAENLIELGGGFYGVIRVGRWWRGVKPPKHKPGRVTE